LDGKISYAAIFGLLFDIRIDSETKEMLAYLRLLKVRFQPNLRKIIKAELSEICKDFKNET
jgi:hypothetical protein